MDRSGSSTVRADVQASGRYNAGTSSGAKYSSSGSYSASGSSQYSSSGRTDYSNVKQRFDNERFIGYVGLWPATFPAPFTPAVEVGWRLAADQWGRGYATEGARAALGYGFDTLGFEEIVSFTSAINRRSWRVMERLGMMRDAAGDFEHPNVPEGHPTRPHVLYRIRRPE